MTAPQDAPAETPAAPAAPAEPTTQLTDDHASALLADAIRLGEEETAASSPWTDPDKARAEIERLRRENASQRTQAKKNAADEARAALTQEISRALGLVKDDEPVDPAKLTEQLTEQTRRAREYQLELAVYRVAGTAGADANALLDSRSFLAKVADLDPADSGAMTAAVKDAVAANPALAVRQAGMKPNPAQGGSSSAPLGIDAQIAAAEAAGNTREAIRLKARKAMTSSA